MKEENVEPYIKWNTTALFYEFNNWHTSFSNDLQKIHKQNTG